MRTIFLLFIVASQHLYSQSPRKLIGLWVVSEVQVGNENMTPDARWVRLNQDQTQQSGNGWFQHTYGEWSFDKPTAALSIISFNGLADLFGSFHVSLKGDQMTWTREEEGMKVVVKLLKEEELPATRRDQLMGLWKLVEATGDGDFFSENVDHLDYLFIRWDGKFQVGSGGKKSYGTYNVHAHKSEIEMIPYSKDVRSFWSVEFTADGFTLSLLKSDKKLTRKFSRIREFPE